ncbi:MAG: hypothetical protein B7Z74_05320 [Deltaproteobacteria bacterium 21-66-5]|nr:MAG: hypothetical protein B7Z74_05320 [Deltaproteobacteria bacterium 21-66-5]
MKTATAIVVTAGLALAAACVSPMGGLLGGRSGQPGQQQPSQMPDENAMMAKSQLMQEMMKNPDLPAWHDQRQQMALALGDRTFDKGFDRIFDSMTVALATLGCRVTNMERSSGYITASLPELPPEQLQGLHEEALRQYAAAKGYPPSVLQKQGPYDIDPDMGTGMMERMGGSGLTLSMVKQGPQQTKVKLRFDNVFYPRMVDELYKKVWAEVDKQVFLDKALD